jgi:CRP-like cAMP-binding protein
LIKILAELHIPNIKHDFTFADMQVLSKRLHYKFLHKGHALFRFNEPADRIYYLMYGTMVVTFPENFELQSPAKTNAFIT